MMPDGYSGDESDAQIARSEVEVTEIVARCNNIYTRFNLSPPMGLRSAAEGWIGLTPDEIVAVLRRHLQEHRRLYTSGAVAEISGWSRPRSAGRLRRSILATEPTTSSSGRGAAGLVLLSQLAESVGRI